ncbi:MAG: indole-3-glycerol phosphate synthase TrpC [Anaerolineae bacterium]|nr:indole-3-glycerol phosphate synthase TrpC [Anaerolineae bacterium]MDW8173113.1 indole-3-glycerol phosphate synthase TrpC [Anaerolineae bacterium]
MTSIRHTDSILDKILIHTAAQLPQGSDYGLQLAQAMEAAYAAPPVRDFVAPLRRETVAIIAEVKKASPSKGLLVADFDPLAVASAYAQGGASAISVLTDEAHFQGHLDHLRQVSAALELPTLRKDFVIDPLQVYQARAAGASAVLLIVAALPDQPLASLLSLVEILGMSALVEVHDLAELGRAIECGATLIGVNNRDLRTFQVDLATTERVARKLPLGITLVAESGIFTPEDVRRMADCGAHAVLVGESLVTAQDRAAAVRALTGVPRRERRED